MAPRGRLPLPALLNQRAAPDAEHRHRQVRCMQLGPPPPGKRGVPVGVRDHTGRAPILTSRLPESVFGSHQEAESRSHIVVNLLLLREGGHRLPPDRMVDQVVLRRDRVWRTAQEEWQPEAPAAHRWAGWWHELPAPRDIRVGADVPTEYRDGVTCELHGERLSRGGRTDARKCGRAVARPEAAPAQLPIQRSVPARSQLCEYPIHPPSRSGDGPNPGLVTVLRVNARAVARLPGMSIHDSPRLLGRAEVAAQLGISYRTLDRLVRAGSLPVVRIDRRPRFLGADVEHLVRDRRSTYPTTQPRTSTHEGAGR